VRAAEAAGLDSMHGEKGPLSLPATHRRAVDWSRHARRWTGILLAVGVVWRLIRYGLAFPLWGDEAGLMLSVVQRRGYAELLRPLEYVQVAPLGFLAAQFAVVRQWGTSEYALRAFPLVTGLAALLLFARLAWLTLPPLGAVSALGVLTASHYVTRYSLDVKPYGSDLMVSALLLLLAVRWSWEPERRRWPVLLILVTPIALALSYPGVFVAGAVALGLVPILRRRARPGDWVLFTTYVAVVTLSFAGLMTLSAAAQYGRVRGFMVAYWSRGFPPADPLRLLVWLLDVHTAEMMSYPLGGKNGASAVTALLCLVGIRQLLTRGQADLLRLLGGTFALTLVAAAIPTAAAPAWRSTWRRPSACSSAPRSRASSPHSPPPRGSGGRGWSPASRCWRSPWGGRSVTSCTRITRRSTETCSG